MQICMKSQSIFSREKRKRKNDITNFRLMNESGKGWVVKVKNDDKKQINFDEFNLTTNNNVYK